MVIVTAGQPRDTLWEQPTGPQMMRRAGSKGTAQTLEALTGPVSEGKMLLGIAAADPRALARAPLDPRTTLAALEGMTTEQVLVLPQRHRLSSQHARRVRSVYGDTMVNLFTAPVRRAIMGSERPSYDALESHQYTVDRALLEAIQLWTGHTPVGYRWRTASEASAVSWMQAIKGSWKSAYQNIVAWRVRVDELQAELNLGKDLQTGKHLRRQDRHVKERKMNHLLAQRTRYIDDSTFSTLPLHETDMIRTEGTPHWLPPVGGRPAHLDHWRFRSPSDAPGDTRTVFLKGLPALMAEDSSSALGMMYKMSAVTDIPFEHHFGQARQEMHWQSQSIAAVLSAQRIVNRTSTIRVYEARPRNVLGEYSHLDLVMPHQPFIIPRKVLNDAVHRLWAQTVISEYNTDRERWTFRPLNEVEIDVIVGHWFLENGYDKGASTDARSLRDEDPQRYLVEVRREEKDQPLRS